MNGQCALCQYYRKWLAKKAADRARWRKKYSKMDRSRKNKAKEHALKI